MRNASTRLALIAIAILLLSPVAPAYYHFIHFTAPFSPYQPVAERFDLNALPDHTLRYYIDQSGPEALAPGDSFPALVSQIRLAAKAWDNVETSELRLAFGGIGSPELSQATPAVDVLFGEMPATSSGASGRALVVARVVRVDITEDVSVCCNPRAWPNS